jgi:hypothetical protein
MRNLHPLILLAGIVLCSNVSHAGCECRCVNGQVVPLCSSTLDLPPICPPRICQIVPPAVRPIDPPRIPPLGAKDCRSEQVYNPGTGQYEWRQVCQ